MLYIVDMLVGDSQAIIEIVATGDDAFEASLAVLKSIPVLERDYDPDSKQWTVENPDDHASERPMLFLALQNYRRQPRLFK